jgi:hypothetical protein
MKIGDCDRVANAVNADGRKGKASNRRLGRVWELADVGLFSAV